MVIQTMDSDGEKVYPKRADRMLEKPSSRNAQGLFPPEACLFVGNIHSKLPRDQQEQDLAVLFSQHGRCYVKVKIDHPKGLPGAFVQFEKREHATAALELNGTQLHNRPLRVERAKGQRTGIISLKSGDPITEEEAEEALKGCGALLGIAKHPYSKEKHCIATFAYLADYNDAIKNFQKDSKYHLGKTMIENNPFSQDGVLDENLVPREPYPAPRSNPSSSRYNSPGAHRPGPPSYPGHRGNFRGFSRPPRRPFQRWSQDSSPPRSYHRQYSQDRGPFYENHHEPFSAFNPNPPFIPPPALPPMTFPIPQGTAPPFITPPNGGYYSPQPGNGYAYPPPSNGFNFPPSPLGNGYNCPPPVNGYPGDFYGPVPPMGPPGFDPSYQGPLIVSSQSHPMSGNPYQQQGPNGFFPPYMPPEGPMNGNNYHPAMIFEQPHVPGPLIVSSNLTIPQNEPRQSTPAPEMQADGTTGDKSDTTTEKASQEEPQLSPEAKSFNPEANGDLEHEEVITTSDETHSSDGSVPETFYESDDPRTIRIKDSDEEVEGEKEEAKDKDQTDLAALGSELALRQKQNGNSKKDAEDGSSVNDEHQSETSTIKPLNGSPFVASPEPTVQGSASPSSPSDVNGGDSGPTQSSIDEQVRELAAQRGDDLKDSLLEEVIRELEEEQRRKKEQEQEEDEKSPAETSEGSLIDTK